MKKIVKLFVVIVFLMTFAAQVSAKQTLEEATDSIACILNNAKKGDAEAQNEVGRWYYIGRHFKQNYKEATKWWAMSAKQGNAKAIGNLSICYLRGQGVKSDSVMASKLMLKAIEKGNKKLLEQNIELAKKGDLFADMLLYQCYKNGIGVSKNQDKAITYITAASEKNSVQAQRELAMIYLNDHKYPKGDVLSTFYYGKMLLEGLGMKINKKEGANYILLAADKGFPQAMYYLGNCYMNGNGLIKNSEQAVKWYKRAAGVGISKAQWELAQCFRNGVGTSVNYNQAMLWYSEAVAHGYAGTFKKLLSDSIPSSPFSDYLHGMKAYYNHDFEEALKDFKKVQKAKISDGKIMTAAILANNLYATKNFKKAVKILKETSESNPQALYLLAGLYEIGKGVPTDMNLAVEAMTKAAELDYGPAICSLADMYYEGRGVEKNYEKAVNLYQTALELGALTENAAMRYSSCYENGWGNLVPDKEKSDEIIKSGGKNYVANLLKLI